MRPAFNRFASLLLAAAVLLMPLGSLAAPAPSAPTPSPTSTPKPSTSMTKSEPILAALIAATNEQTQQEQFALLVNPRLKYATARSLCARNGNWLASVDIYELYNNAKPSGYRIQQAIVQYGVYNQPPAPVSCALSVGEYTAQIEQRLSSIYLFETDKLGADALKGDVSVTVTSAGGGSVLIELSENLPGTVEGKEASLARMARSYATYLQSQEAALPVDHAYMRLRSHITDTKTLAHSYTWELFLVHGYSFPAQATLVRHNLQTDQVSISRVEVKS